MCYSYPLFSFQGSTSSCDNFYILSDILFFVKYFFKYFSVSFRHRSPDSFSFLQQLIYINRIFFSCPVLFQIQFDIYFTDKQQAIPLPQERSIYNVRRISFEHIIMHNQMNNFDCLYICAENKRMPK